MAAALRSEEPHAMFARFFTACFHRRPERTTPPSSQKSRLPPESSSDTGTEGSESAFSSAFSQPSLPRQSPVSIPQNDLPAKPSPTLSTKDPDTMVKSRPAVKKQPAAKSAAKAAPPALAPMVPGAKTPKVTKTTKKLKSKYFAGIEPEDDLSRLDSKKIDDKLTEMFKGLLSNQDREADSSSKTMGAESLENYFKQLGLSLENYELFVLLDIVQAEGLGQVSLQGFLNGWKAAWADPNHRVQPDITSQKKYARHCVSQASRDPGYFKKLYQRAFLAGKEPQQKALDKENALVFWELLFDPAVHPWKSKNVDWLSVWKEFLTEKWTRSVNKDMWSQTLLFADKTMQDETLSFWSEDQAWPGVIDDFVAWCRETGVAPTPKTSNDGMEVDE